MTAVMLIITWKWTTNYSLLFPLCCKTHSTWPSITVQYIRLVLFTFIHAIQIVCSVTTAFYSDCKG